MFKRVRYGIAALLMIGLVASVAPLRAQSTSPLLQLLANVPATPENGYVTYLDIPALFSSRPGAKRPTSLAEFQAARADRAVGGLMMAVLQGFNSGDSEVIQRLGLAEGMIQQVGIDPFTITHMLTAGDPPTDLSILLGDFDEGAIQAAYTQRGYTATPRDPFTVLCPAAGCEDGLRTNLRNRAPENPFGGAIGRQEPLLYADNIVLSSADIAVLEGVITLPTRAVLSLANDPATRALAQAALAAGEVTQAHFIRADRLNDIAVGATPQETAGTLPPYAALLFAHTFKGDQQMTLIGLAYASEADAKTALLTVAERIDAYQVRRGPALREAFKLRGGELGEGYIFAHEGQFVAVFPVVGPLDSADRQPPVASAQVMRLLVQMLSQRDLGWLAANP